MKSIGAPNGHGGDVVGELSWNLHFRSVPCHPNHLVMFLSVVIKITFPTLPLIATNFLVLSSFGLPFCPNIAKEIKSYISAND